MKERDTEFPLRATSACDTEEDDEYSAAGARVTLPRSAMDHPHSTDLHDRTATTTV
jgi:hypothetical protein